MLEQILTFPQEIQGMAWLLHQRDPSLSADQLRKLAYRSVNKYDQDSRLTDDVVPIVAQAVDHVTKAYHNALEATRPITVRLVAELGEPLAIALSEGYNVTQAAQQAGIGYSLAAKRVATCRHKLTEM